MEEDISNDPALSSIVKSMVALKLLSVSRNITEGADAHLQLMDFGCEVNLIMTQPSYNMPPITYY